jgi:hypothetical protein
MQILSRISGAVVSKSDGIIREVLIPGCERRDVPRSLGEVPAHSGPQYRLIKQTPVRKFVRQYRRTLSIFAVKSSSR